MRARAEIVRETPVSALLDGHFAMGHLNAAKAMNIAIEKAKKTGIGMVVVRNSSHYGIAGYYPLMAEREGLAAFSMTNTGPIMVPTFGCEMMLGTNPMAFCMPADPYPFWFDASTTVVTLVAVVCWLLRVLLQGGWVLYHLGVRRGEEMPYATLFDGFGFIGKLILLNIVITLYVFLWSMLLIIPGIIASYRYRFAVYNLCENPDMGVMEAISMSKAQTAGYKGDLFLLDLTFIGWNLLCSLTLGILSIWIAPYIIQTNIGYFQEIKRIKGIGWQARPEQPDDTFHPTDPFGPEL